MECIVQFVAPQFDWGRRIISFDTPEQISLWMYRRQLFRQATDIEDSVAVTQRLSHGIKNRPNRIATPHQVKYKVRTMNVMRICRQRWQCLPRGKSVVVPMKRDSMRPVGKDDVIPTRGNLPHDARDLIEIRAASRAPRIQRRKQDQHQRRGRERNSEKAKSPADRRGTLSCIGAGSYYRHQAEEIPGLYVVIEQSQKKDISYYTHDD